MSAHETGPPDAATRSVTIVDLGGRGDGIARVGDQRWFVAGALAGEQVLARPTVHTRDGVHAELDHIERSSADRVIPPCRHFADAAAPCGGCSLQHLASQPYLDYKRGLIVHALQHRALPADETIIGTPIVTAERTRRRVTLSAVGVHGGVILGFHQRRSKRVVDLADCIIALPTITQALPALRTALAAYLRPGERASVALAAIDSGLVVEITGPVRYPSRRVRDHLEQFAGDVDACRLAWRPRSNKPFSVLADRRPVIQRIAGVDVELPFGAFLQATSGGEAAIRDRVLAALEGSDSSRIADLYAGCGSLSLPLAVRGHRVRAVEGERSQVRALAAAADRAGLAVTAERRDLDARPLSAGEFAECDAVVFDPPRAGARAVVRELARSTVPTVIAVSCHPGTFARDARTLVDGGYRLERVQPIDQFLYSSHVELVAEFRRSR